MNRRVVTYISLSLLCSFGLLAQNWRPIDKGWTDKNNTERYAEYLLATTYYQQGYCAAKVEVKQDGPIRINDWTEQVRKNYAQSTGPLESVTWGVKFDYAHSQANVEISVKERN